MTKYKQFTASYAMADGRVMLHSSHYKPSKKFNLNKKRHERRDKTKYILVDLNGNISTIHMPYGKIKIRR